MKIAQVAPLLESVPPAGYGGTERIVSFLTEELVRQGHRVTLFASGESATRAELVPCCPRALRLNGGAGAVLPYHVLQLEKIRQRAREFDVLHFHSDLLHFPLARTIDCPVLTTMHGRLDLPELRPLYEEFRELPLVSISNSQREPLQSAGWIDTVPHGLPRGLLPFRSAPDDGYLAFLGRISPEKGPDRAIEIANRAGMPLRIAAKIDPADQSYWEQKIQPLVRAHPAVEFVGEIGEDQKAEFLGRARALLFPIDWPEPFGLSMVEALACGTPVIAFDRGSVPEVIENGVSGFVVADVSEAVHAISQVDRLDRKAVRQAFEMRFTVEGMTRRYVRLYRDLARSSPRQDGIRLPEAVLEGGIQTRPYSAYTGSGLRLSSLKAWPIDPGESGGGKFLSLELTLCSSPSTGALGHATPYRFWVTEESRQPWSGTLAPTEGGWTLHNDLGDDEPVWVLLGRVLRPGEHLTLCGPCGRQVVFRIGEIRPSATGPGNEI